MEIKKGYTSQQFGFYLKSLTTKEFCELSGAPVPYYRNHWTAQQNALDFMRADAIKLRLRDDWDKYILKELKKEYFTHSILHPDKCIFKKDYVDVVSYEMAYDAQLLSFEEAENKVIFKGWHYNKEWTQYTIELDKLCVSFHDKLIYMFTNNYGLADDEIHIRTIGDLFQATNGELITQNINL
jgi:hypothetical protein